MSDSETVHKKPRMDDEKAVIDVVEAVKIVSQNRLFCFVANENFFAGLEME